LKNKAAGSVRGSIPNAPFVSCAMLQKGYTAREYGAQKKQKYKILSWRVKKMRSVFREHLW
jgi:hypothetical protein